MPVARPLLLMSPGPEDEARLAYTMELREHSRQAAIMACRLGGVLVPCFGFLDAIVFPQHLATFLVMRAACAAGIAVVLWLLARPLGHRHPEMLALVVACLIALTIDVMITQTGGVESRYHAGLSLVLLGVTVLMPWSPAWTIAATLLVIGSYLVAVSVVGPIREPAVLVNNLFFLVVTGIIAAFGSMLGGRLRWREFSQRSALEVAVRHKSDFMAKMSHELRTPLHAIIGYADIMLESATDNAEDRRLVERIRSRGLFLHRMITDLLDYAKAEAGRMEVRREPIHVARVVEQVGATFRPLVERKGLTFDVRIAPDLPAIASDAHRLEQVLTNLLANAAKFTERGGIIVETRLVGETPPGFTVLGATGHTPAVHAVAVLVTDTGVGVREHDLRQLANDFQQLDGAADRFGGTGLGLSISRQLVDLLGGRLVVRSRHGAGSTFGILLPCPAPAVDAAPVAQRPRAWMTLRAAASSSS